MHLKSSTISLLATHICVFGSFSLIQTINKAAAATPQKLSTLIFFMLHSMGPVLVLQVMLITVDCVLVLDVRLAVGFGPLGQHLVLRAA